jgi:cytochrome c peroxidase
VPNDPTNRVSGKRDAIEFGTRLFFDQRLSGHGTMSCASCHVPERNWSDNLRRGVGMVEVERNTPTLMNLLGRRYGWGTRDSLWSQSLRPILDKRELAATPRHVAQLVRNDEQLSCRYRKAFGTPPPATDDEAVFVDVGKALAAFQETLMSGSTPFDQFRGLGAAQPPSSRYSDGAARTQDLYRQRRFICHSARISPTAGSSTPANPLAPLGNPIPDAAGSAAAGAVSICALQRRCDGGRCCAHSPGLSREGEFRRVQGAVTA